MTGFDVLQLVRYQTNDMQDTGTSYYDKINAVNAANRFMRRLALEFNPNILNATETANTVVGTSTYTLTKIPNKILDFRVNGKRIYQIEMQSIDDLTKTGTPTHYWRSAYNTFTLYPIPDAVVPYVVTMIEATTDWTEATTVPWSPDLVDLIVAYAVGLLGGNLDLNFMRVETKKLLTDYNPNAVIISGYWDNYSPLGGDYK